MSSQLSLSPRCLTAQIEIPKSIRSEVWLGIKVVVGKEAPPGNGHKRVTPQSSEGIFIAVAPSVR
jgi:hypothetical protein